MKKTPLLFLKRSRVYHSISLFATQPFKAQLNVAEPTWVSEQLALATDLTPIIINTALASDVPSATCIETVKTFAAIIAAEAGNLALKVLATGGVYIGQNRTYRPIVASSSGSLPTLRFVATSLPPPLLCELSDLC